MSVSTSEEILKRGFLVEDKGCTSRDYQGSSESQLDWIKSEDECLSIMKKMQ